MQTGRGAECKTAFGSITCRSAFPKERLRYLSMLAPRSPPPHPLRGHGLTHLSSRSWFSVKASLQLRVTAMYIVVAKMWPFEESIPWTETGTGHSSASTGAFHCTVKLFPPPKSRFGIRLWFRVAYSVVHRSWRFWEVRQPRNPLKRLEIWTCLRTD